MTYIDGFVLAVPTAKKEAYLELARACVPVFKKYGALRMVENWGVTVPDGEVTSFAMAVKAKPDETILFSWIVWPSKEIRDAGTDEMMKDTFFETMMAPPFDGKRMIIGGLETILDE